MPGTRPHRTAPRPAPSPARTDTARTSPPGHQAAAARTAHRFVRATGPTAHRSAGSGYRTPAAPTPAFARARGYTARAGD